MAILTQLLLMFLAALLLWKYAGPTVAQWAADIRAVGQTHHQPPAGHGGGHAEASPYVKIVIFVPVAYSDTMRDVLAHAHAGARSGFAGETFSVRGLGRWQRGPAVHADHGHADAHDPHGAHGHHDAHSHDEHAPSGPIGEAIYGEEDRIEAVVPRTSLDGVLSDLRKIHVEPHMAVEVYPLELSEL